MLFTFGASLLLICDKEHDEICEFLLIEFVNLKNTQLELGIGSVRDLLKPE